MNSNYSRRQFLKRSTLAAGALALAPDGVLRAQTAGQTHGRGRGDPRQDRHQTQPPRHGHRQQQRPHANRPGPGWFHQARPLCLRSGHPATSTAPNPTPPFEWIADAIKGLPREKLFIQSKIDGKPADMPRRH